MKTGVVCEKKAHGKTRNYLKEMIDNRYLYLLMLPAVAFYLIFAYVPMFGLTLAFKDYDASLGILGSEWVGLKHFRSLVSDPYFWYVLKNTIVISFGRLIFEFPVPIVLALLFNELRSGRKKKILQTVFTFPHFLSWVVLSGILINMLDYNGPINSVLACLGFERISFMGEKELFKPILFASSVWKEGGWSSIIYMAAIAGINTEFYEAADLDGANRLQKIWHITLPSIRGTILVLLILQVGAALSGGFDQIFNMTNPVVQKAGDILDTYIYRITFQTSGDFSFSTAVGMFMSVVNFSLVVTANWFSRTLDGVGVLE